MNTLNRFCVAVLATCIGLVATSASAADWSPAVQKIIDDAKREGQLTLSTGPVVAGGPNGRSVIAAGIATLFGVKLDVEWSPALSFGPMAAKLQQEFQAGVPASTDLYFASAPQVGPYVDGRLFRRVPWAELWPDRIGKSAAEYGQSLRFESFLPGILYNVKAAPWVSDIKVMADVLKPEYKGKFATTPYLSGFDALVAENAWGKAKTTAFVTQLAGQISGLLACAGTDRIASGEVAALVLDCGGSAQNVPKYKGILDTKVPSDIAMRRYLYMQVPSNAVHPNAAMLAALYLVSPAGQHDVAFALDGIDDDDYPETWAHARVAALEKEGSHFFDVDIAWWKSNPNLAKDLGDLVKIIQRSGG
jgi:ABC-type Fe3+ transport system substrate-binding protein